MPQPLTLKRRIEGALVHGLITLCAALPLDTASAFGGLIGRTLGKHTGITRKALRQLHDILPTLTDAQATEIITAMWDNLGRTMAEYPHLETIGRTRITVDDRAGLTAAQFKSGPAIFIGGHFANWEVSGAALYAHYDTALDLVYRAPNNAIVDRLLNRCRTLDGKLQTIPKSRAGMRTIIENLSKGHTIGILIDQKYNEGIAVDFFGRPAMTSTAFAQMGQKFHCPVYPAQIIRENGAHFRIIVHPPLTLTAADGTNRPLADIAADANKIIESWMHEHPEQWLWLHQRWSSKALQEQNDTDDTDETIDGLTS